MNSVNAQSALKEYGKVNVQSGANYASPHRLIMMLLEGALEKISAAKGYMLRKELANKGNYISWAITIIEGLRVSLDHQQGGEIAANLERLYDYMERRLVEANQKNDAEMLEEVAGLLNQIKSAWSEIPAELHGSPQTKDENVSLSGSATQESV